MNPDMNLHDLLAIQEKGAPDEADVRALLARIPPSWTMGDRARFGAGDGAIFKRGTLQVICSLSREEDGCLWVHVSACGRLGERRFYLPNWEEMKRVKNDFIGPDAWAYQVFPSAKDYVNHHAYVLHLFARFDGKPALPDFTRGTGMI